MSETPKAKAADLKAAIAKRYAAPAWQTCFEVGSATGAVRTSYADAVAMGLWPSNGHEIIGFEVKVSRSDWLVEKARPEKAFPVMRYCHRWFLVAPAGMVKSDELPETWGLLSFDGGKLREVRKAPRLSPEPASPGFMAAMVRRAGEGDERTRAALVAAAQADARVAYEKRVAEAVERKFAAIRSDDDRRRERLAKIEAALGDSVSRFYDDAGFAKAVAFVNASGITGSYNRVSAALNALRSAERELSGALAKADIGADA